MAESRLNIELFKKIRQRIAEIPESYDQDYWVEDSAESPCGTVACLAGHAIICDAPTIERGISDLHRLKQRDPLKAVPRRAAKLLGLTGSWTKYVDTSSESAGGETIIFDSDAAGWPEPFQSDFQMAGGRGKSQVAVRYLDHIISTGKVLE